MDRLQLRERMRLLSGVLMDTLLEDDQAEAYLNEAYFSICSLAEWSFLYAEEVVSTSSADIPLPGDIGRVQAVSLSDSAADRNLLRRVNLLDIARYPKHRNDGLPWAWAMKGDDSVRIFPEPDAELDIEVRGWIDVPELAADADEPVFHSEFHAVVAYEAAANVLEAEGDDSGRSRDYRGEVQSYLGRMSRRYLPEGGQVVYAGAAEDDEAQAEQVPGEVAQ